MKSLIRSALLLAALAHPAAFGHNSADSQTRNSDIQAASNTAKAPKLPEKTADSDAAGIDLLHDAARLAQAQAALYEIPLFRQKTIRIFEQAAFFGLPDPRIEVALQHPDKPDEIVFYIYRNGQWQQSVADDISHVKNMAQHLLPLRRIRFADAAAIAQKWQQKAREHRAVWNEAYYVALTWLPEQRKAFWHTATIEAIGAQYYVSFHFDGKTWEDKVL